MPVVGGYLAPGRVLWLKLIFYPLPFLEEVGIGACFSFVGEVAVPENMCMREPLYHIAMRLVWWRDIVALDTV